TNIVASADPGQCSKSNVTYSATASDNCSTVSVVCTPASGSTFAKGTNLVTCLATDGSGNTNGCTFSVTINDTQAPAITCPANVVASTDAGQCSKSNVTFSATASDNCSTVSVVCTPASGSTFAKGTNLVTCLATDGSGNTNGCSFSVTINDTAAPANTYPLSLHDALPICQCSKSNVTFSATASDNCSTVSV